MGRGRAHVAVAMLLVVLGAFFLPRSPAAAQDADRLTWWALGDSFSSGEGIPGTAAPAVGQPDCARASGASGAKAWAVLTREELADSRISEFRFVPCTGAISSDVPAQMEEAAKGSASDSADVVTLSMGGNDIYFADVIAGCIDLSASWDLVDLTPGCDIDEARLRRRIDMLAGNLQPTSDDYRGLQLPKLYDTIASKVRPGGVVIVAGYPQLVDEVGRWDAWRRRINHSCEGVHDYDVPMLRSAAGYLNQQIALAVQAANERWSGKGVRFEWRDLAAGVYETDAGRHGLCSPEPWINGVTTSLSSGDLRKERSFHPKQEGHTATGRWLASWMRDTALVDGILARQRSLGSLVAAPTCSAADVDAIRDAMSPGGRGYLARTAYPHRSGQLFVYGSDPTSGTIAFVFTPDKHDGDFLAEGGVFTSERVVESVGFHEGMAPQLGPLYGQYQARNAGVRLDVWFEGDELVTFGCYESPDPRVAGQATEFATGLTLFSSPSGNIGCAASTELVRCDIAEASWPPPVPVGDCPLDFGDSIMMTLTDPAAFECHGDTALHQGGTLEYGESISVGPFICASAEEGIACRDRRQGSGFVMSRDSYRLF